MCLDSGNFKDHVEYGASLIKTAKNHIQTIHKLIQGFNLNVFSLYYV